MLFRSKDVLADENAMQEEVNETYDKLIRAYLELRLRPNKDLLTDLINKAQGLNATNYTEATWKILEETLIKAKAVEANEEATELEINNARAAMEKAIEGLEIKSSLPGEIIKPVTPQNKDNGKEKAIKTGDTINIVYPVTGLAIASIVLVINKKRKHLS